MSHGPITDLNEILASLRVVNAGEFVYALMSDLPSDCRVLATFNESEGSSAVVAARDARALNLDCSDIFACLTLDVHSALTSVGLTALVSSALAEAGISCNVVAGYYHDHLLVPVKRADEATRLLEQLRR
ncbi:ACT domain-containing protein [Arcanobacterium haemolyticum]|nr:ACT domain-containing protein [Arcanobacterium haemolyticum]